MTVRARGHVHGDQLGILSRIASGPAMLTPQTVRCAFPQPSIQPLLAFSLFDLSPCFLLATICLTDVS
jgi:hypothetical protein